MRHSRSTLRFTRAATAAAILLLIGAQGAFADTAAVDADTATVGSQNVVDLGDVAPGSHVSVPLAFVVTCSGTSHVDPGESVTFTLAGGTVPEDGSLTITTTAVGPIGGFPADGQVCPTPAPSASATVTADVLAPTVEGGPYKYALMFSTSTSNGDGGAVGALAFVDLVLTVVSNTPPALQLPAGVTTEGNESNGAMVTFDAAATDAEDAAAPAVDCSPASGSHFALGTTTVACSATDTGGLTTRGAFEETVTDTTAPTIEGPASLVAVTKDAAGTHVAYGPPIAQDVVDPSPDVACAPASGSAFPVGTTTVTCTATDASGNQATASFDVTVRLGQAVFDAPIGPSNVVDVNGSRSIPVKAQLTLDGEGIAGGTVTLVLTPCGGGATARSVDLVPSNGRWTGKVDASGLDAGCWRATALVGSAGLGSFDIRVLGSATPSKAAKPTR
jgi:hypothetical protein